MLRTQARTSILCESFDKLMQMCALHTFSDKFVSKKTLKAIFSGVEKGVNRITC